MRPDDSNGLEPTSERPLRVLLIAASQRRRDSTPGLDSKSRSLVMRMSSLLPPSWQIDVEDIGNVHGRERIQSCNACVSTSMALCVWPCNCYRRDDDVHPDLLWNLDLYARLDLADAWAFVAPINWYAPPSNLKAMFDRLVCMGGGNPEPSTIDGKDPALAMRLEHEERWWEMSVNHLAGRTAAFFVHGDAGGADMGEDGRPRRLFHASWFDPEREPFVNERDAFAPLVWQCRYSGIEVPDALWRYGLVGEGRPHSDNQIGNLARERAFLSGFDAWIADFVAHVAAKGKVEPGRWRATGRGAAGEANRQA